MQTIITVTQAVLAVAIIVLAFFALVSDADDKVPPGKTGRHPRFIYLQTAMIGFLFCAVIKSAPLGLRELAYLIVIFGSLISLSLGYRKLYFEKQIRTSSQPSSVN